MKNVKIGVKAKIVLLVVVVGCVIATWAHNRDLANEQVERFNVEKAKDLSEQIRATRGYYAKKVVGPVKAAGLKASHDYDGVDGTIPLPATMTHEINVFLTPAAIRTTSTSSARFRFHGDRTVDRETSFTGKRSSF